MGGDVVLFINETYMKSCFTRCRICYEEEEEAESYFEAPCSCSGTIKFAHRDCIQRWCDEKGNTICEICLQEYKPGYTTTLKPCRLIEAAAVTIRENLHIAKRENGGRRNRRLVSRAESDFPECNSVADRGASCCRYLALIIEMDGIDLVGTNNCINSDEPIENANSAFQLFDVSKHEHEKEPEYEHEPENESEPGPVTTMLAPESDLKPESSSFLKEEEDDDDVTLDVLSDDDDVILDV